MTAQERVLAAETTRALVTAGTNAREMKCLIWTEMFLHPTHADVFKSHGAQASGVKNVLRVYN